MRNSVSWSRKRMIKLFFQPDPLWLRITNA
jgi:hypothetical protein